MRVSDVDSVCVLVVCDHACRFRGEKARCIHWKGDHQDDNYQYDNMHPPPSLVVSLEALANGRFGGCNASGTIEAVALRIIILLDLGLVLRHTVVLLTGIDFQKSYALCQICLAPYSGLILPVVVLMLVAQRSFQRELPARICLVPCLRKRHTAAKSRDMSESYPSEEGTICTTIQGLGSDALSRPLTRGSRQHNSSADQLRKNRKYCRLMLNRI